eukprot:gene1602-2843_t
MAMSPPPVDFWYYYCNSTEPTCNGGCLTRPYVQLDCDLYYPEGSARFTCFDQDNVDCSGTPDTCGTFPLNTCIDYGTF